jgi:hypothetical protein
MSPAEFSISLIAIKTDGFFSGKPVHKSSSFGEDKKGVFSRLSMQNIIQASFEFIKELKVIKRSITGYNSGSAG